MVPADDWKNEKLKVKSNLRIAVNAQIKFGSGTGGIETVLRELTGLARLDGGGEEYIFVGHHTDGGDWLKPFLSERMKIVGAPSPRDNTQIIFENFRNSLGRLRPLARAVKRVFTAPEKAQIGLPMSNGFYESLGCGVVHFPYQDYALCSVPTVYNPHDLQHLHFPQFFAREEIERREAVYPAACRAADFVAVASGFVKQDVMKNYAVAPDKIQVIAWAPPSKNNLEKVADEDARRVLKKYGIGENAAFALYPAMTWEHKNHIRLLEAVARLRDSEDLKINLICTGDRNDFFPQIERRLRELNLEEQVKFPGVVSYRELSALYLRAQFVIIPTLFEAASAPLFEAWQQGVAVACSSVTSLPEQASGAALLFNPFSVEAISEALKKMSADDSLRASLRERGARRLRDFNLERTLKTYRAVYRKAARLKLNDEDVYLLNRN